MALSTGIDIGSKTIKAVVLKSTDDDSTFDIEPIYATYAPHNGRVRAGLSDLLAKLEERFGAEPMRMSLTGSGATGLAQTSGVPFTQEVVAAHRSIRALYPKADAFIELGGEDAKLVFLREPVEHRMNTSCAGGTGSFIEDTANMLGVTMTELDELADAGVPRFEIAARCAVFAQRDLKPLLAAGENRADIAASAYQAVVNQTLATLASGRVLDGTVLFLGGPMEHLPALVERFKISLQLDDEHGIKPRNAQLMSALGSALGNGNGENEALVADFARRLLESASGPQTDLSLLKPLVPTGKSADKPSEGLLETTSLRDAELPLYVGFDAGSTTIKMAAIDSGGRLAASSYNVNPGDPSAAAKRMLEDFKSRCVKAGVDPANNIRRIVACGYGEQMLMDVVGADDAMAETAAHLRGALAVFPQASFVLDIGGQDMKALWVKEGTLTSTAVNETCSSGCGAFMSSAANTLGMSLDELDCAALAAKRPVDLGARCTVFMRSRVRHAQEMGAQPEDIAAGAAYSVANNALRRLIGPKRMNTLGDFVVVQGGAFASDAVARAFESELGQETHRSPLSPLMGAIGAAFFALDNVMRRSSSESACGNEGTKAPNVAALQQELLDSYRGHEGRGARAEVRVGLIAAMNDYESLPFWHACLTELGFSVVVPHDCKEKISQTQVASTLMSDMVCLPAQQIHLHALQLAQAGATVIFCPTSAEGGMCPVTREYQQVLPHAMKHVLGIPIHVPQLTRFSPRAMTKALADPEELRECMEALLPDGDSIAHDELVCAASAGYEAYLNFVADIEDASDKTLDWIHADKNRHGIVLSGRSYHTAPELLNGIDVVLNEQGFAVLPPLGVNKQANKARRPFVDRTIDRRRNWIAGKRMVGFAALAVVDPQLDVVCLQSFGCGIDSVSLIDVQRLLEEHDKPFTLIKLDSKADTAHTKIRVRALADSIANRRQMGDITKRDTRSESDTQQGTCEDEKLENAVLSIKLASEASVFQPSLTFKGITEEDVEYAQRCIPSDMCGTAALLAAHAVNESKRSPETRIQLPAPCEGCITRAAQHLVSINGLDNLIEWVSDWPSDDFIERQATMPPDAPKIGLCGNPLILFDAQTNQGVAEFIKSQGAAPIYPALDTWYSDCGHYIPQLESLYAQGIRHVLMLQSFMCLKTHVHVRGAMDELREMFPKMRFTIVDIDPQASSLNVRNRVLLALEELRHDEG